jgi:hypothetical protein
VILFRYVAEIHKADASKRLHYLQPFAMVLPDSYARRLPESVGVPSMRITAHYDKDGYVSMVEDLDSLELHDFRCTRSRATAASAGSSAPQPVRPNSSASSA